MIIIETLDKTIWNIDQKIIEIIKEYNSTGAATISFNNEGPCCRANNFYNILDNICESLHYNKSNIKIITCNKEENHPEYQISNRHRNHWIDQTITSAKKYKFAINDFKNKTQFSNNLFALFVNRPAWNRLCLLSYLKFNTKHRSILTCNPSWMHNDYNVVQLDEIIKYAPSELQSIQKFLETPTAPLLNSTLDKDLFDTNITALFHYNDFFAEIVCETYTSGNTFFPTEKTFRPIYGMTPFITYGSQGFLSNLKARYGFKTFDRWWDESYDNCQHYDRVKKMYKVISYIDNLSKSEIASMYTDMQDTLEYNANQLFKI